MMDTLARLQTIDVATLTPPVRLALRSERAEVLEWSYEPLHYMHSETIAGGIYRFRGTALNHGEIVPWSMVLKAVVAAPGARDPSSSTYWRREVAAYQSGFLARLPAGVAAPSCYWVMEHMDEGAWLWLEDVSSEPFQPWTLDEYQQAALHLGRFNGGYLAGEQIPEHPSLSDGWLRALVDLGLQGLERLPEAVAHPLGQRVFPGATADRLLHLAADREVFLQVLEALPQTFCHMDAWCRNLFVRTPPSSSGVVAIDWSFSGRGAVGEDLAPLVTGSSWFEDNAHCPCELDRVSFDAYLDGLREAGWHGDREMVRFGYTAASALRYGLGYLGPVLDTIMNQSEYPHWEQRYGQPMTDVAERLAGLFRFVLEHADEARDLRRAAPIKPRPLYAMWSQTPLLQTVAV